MKPTRCSHRFSATVFACAGFLGAGILAGAPAVAQTTPTPLPPSCSMTAMSPASTNAAANSSFVCIGDLNSDGTSNLIVGAILQSGTFPTTGYALYLTNNGTIAKKVCWGNAAVCPTTP